MMKTFRTLIAALLLATGSITALADDYQYLTISGSGSENSFSVSKIQKITFEASNMVLVMTDGTEQRLPLAGLEKMFFATSPSGIATVSTTQSKMQFSNGVLRATVAAGETIAVYNMKGEKVFSANESGSYDLSNLQRGVYIVKVGSETRKVVNK
jgi:predicted polyphosphate/ATP-dependent NAD kinase